MDKNMKKSIGTNHCKDDCSKPQIDVESIADLAQLSLTEDEKERFSVDMASIISFADTLSALDTKDVLPAAHVVAVNNIFREDKVKPCIPRENMLSQARTRTDEYITVPRVVEGQ